MINDPILVNDWHPVGTIRQLAENNMLKVRLLGEDLVVWRADGQVRAWQDLCIHRGARLSLGKVKGDTLACAYHGWVYNGEGACIHIPAHPDQAPPAKARAKSYHAQVCYDLIWVCLGEPHNPIPVFPEWEKDSYRKLLCGPYKINAHGPRIIENFLDVGHFPFVHEGILGDQAYPEIADYTAEVIDHRQSRWLEM